MVIGVLLNGLSRAMLLFLIASGLSLIFGLMGVINFAHGVLYALGGYVGVAVLQFSESFWLALVVAPFLVMFLGITIEYFGVRPLYDREPVFQMLLTFGIAVVLEELIKLIWGTSPKSLPAADGLVGTTPLGVTIYPTYRLFIIVMGFVVAAGLWTFLQRTRVGMIVRAGTLDSEMVEIMGINVRRMFTLMFGLGTALAALGGIVAGPLISVYPAMGTEILIEAFIVVVVGGLGSIRGSLAGALIIGMANGFGAYYVSKYVGFILFAIMIFVLLTRPYGIFGKPGVHGGG